MIWSHRRSGGTKSLDKITHPHFHLFIIHQHLSLYLTSPTTTTTARSHLIYLFKFIHRFTIYQLLISQISLCIYPPTILEQSAHLFSLHTLAVAVSLIGLGLT
ncbi:hypothetical protein L6452_28498 [Arctium lappa]|uniref:Uncharacterized protein n=1 Tax=Arctium lappa TaxID=4217 RepID=A0ACB8ZZL4_ARCLA|nr:hypothetical protein L6452_28498 [Arctium lappa]